MKSTNTNIKSIIISLQNKEKEAISVIYNQYGAALYGVIFRIVKSEATAQTVLKEVFVQMWKQAEEYNESKEKFFTWLYRISHHLAMEAVRSNQSTPVEMYTISNNNQQTSPTMLFNRLAS